jgi:hypothetical protein
MNRGISKGTCLTERANPGKIVTKHQIQSSGRLGQGAGSMLRVAIQLAASVLGVKVPAVFTTELEKGSRRCSALPPNRELAPRCGRCSASPAATDDVPDGYDGRRPHRSRLSGSAVPFPHSRRLGRRGGRAPILAPGCRASATTPGPKVWLERVTG